MSAIHPNVEIEYPESDGKPMGETDWHISAIIRLRDMLRLRYRGQRVYVGSDLLIYFVEGEPRRFIVPDVFVVFDCDPKDRRTFKTWEENRVPDVVFEITSRSTAREDKFFKPRTYEEIGVQEMFLFDPTGEHLVPRLQGFRLTGLELVPMQSQYEHFHSSVLNVDISANETILQLTDSITGKTVLTGEEFECQAKEMERRARIEAEARVVQMQAELDRLRTMQS
ncbi:MAG: Uma2 family endonuclease [Pirellula sp.]